MSTLKLFAAIALAAASVAGTAQAANGVATREEAVAMVKKAVAFYRSQGAEAAFAEFNKPSGPFNDGGDLYLFVYNEQGIVQAHGANQKLIGQNLMGLKDPDGVLVIKGLIDLAFHGPGKGWFEYKWPHPVSKAIETKAGYVERVDDVLIGCGIYILALPEPFKKRSRDMRY